MGLIGRISIAVGFLLILFGGFMLVASKFFPSGKLPGDILIERENWKLYLPITSSLILSLLFSLALWLYRWLRGGN